MAGGGVEMFPFLLLLRKAIQIINAVEKSPLRWRLPGYLPNPHPTVWDLLGRKKKKKSSQGDSGNLHKQ